MLFYLRPARLGPHAVAITETAGLYFRKPPTTGSGVSESVAGREGGGDHLLLDLLGHGHGGSGKRGRAVPIMDAPDAGAMSPRHFFEFSRARATGGIGPRHEKEGFWKSGRRLGGRRGQWCDSLQSVDSSTVEGSSQSNWNSGLGGLQGPLARGSCENLGKVGIRRATK